MNEPYPIRDYLEQFERLSSKLSVPIPWSVQLGSKKGPHIVVTSMLHGDEVGSLPALVKILEEGVEFAGTLTLVLGNVPASHCRTRYLQDDLNRVFLDNPASSWERKRAQEIMPLIRGADVYIDFHQTKAPSELPFYISPFHLPSYYWARLLGATSAAITRMPGLSFVNNARCSDEYAHMNNVPGLTIELGQRGFTTLAENIAYQTIKRALEFAPVVHKRPSDLKKLAEAEKELEFFEGFYTEHFTDPRRKMKEEMSNFTFVKKGQVVGTCPVQGELRSPEDGFMLFPQHPPRDTNGFALGPATKDLYSLVRRLDVHPGELYKVY